MKKRHIFIINPAAGSRDSSSAAVRRIEEVCRKYSLEYDIYLTANPAHATDIVKRAAAAHQGRELVFYACGGDGTLNEVANGVAVLKGSLGFTAYPIGTGNDYIKMFEGGKKAFLDLDRLVNGQAVQVDYIMSDCGCAVNILTVGMDAEVSMRKRKYGILGGEMLPYCAAAVETVIKGTARQYYINIDGQQYDGEYSLIFIGNGRVYGGGFCPVPKARIDDGKLDVLMIGGVTRLQAARLIGKYKNGRFEELGDIAKYVRAEEIKIFSKDNSDMCINLDGEIVSSSHISMRIQPKRLSFILPKGSKLMP